MDKETLYRIAQKERQELIDGTGPKPHIIMFFCGVSIFLCVILAALIDSCGH